MKEHPLLLSTPMVQAVLDGRKTQTRRVLKQNNTLFDGYTHIPYGLDGHTFQDFDLANARVSRGPSPAGNPGPYLKASYPRGMETTHRLYPRIQPGDRIWFRETWALTESDSGPVVAYKAGGRRIHMLLNDDHGQPTVNAIGPDPEDPSYTVERWRPSLYMPRWACRLVVEVVSVRPERVKDITEKDAIQEGIESTAEGDWRNYMDQAARLASPVGSFRSLWTSINGPGSWTANPWVWAYKFRPVDA